MADEKFRKATEGLLSSVIISAKGGVPLHRLAREFKEITLSDIPLEKLGFKSLELYIKSIPHCARIETDNNGVTVVKGVPNDRNKHVAKLVSGQKGKSGGAGKKSSRLPPFRGRGGRGRSSIHVVRKGMGAPAISSSFVRQQLRGSAPRRAASCFPINSGGYPLLTERRDFAAPRMNRIGQKMTGQGKFYQTDHLHKSSSAPNFSHGKDPILKEVQNIRHAKRFETRSNSQAPMYQLPPRMRNLQQQSKKQESVIQHFDDRELDLRGVINEKKKSGTSRDMAEQRLTVTIKNDLMEKRIVESQISESLRRNLIEFFQEYKNGIWADVLPSIFKKKYGDAPEDLVGIIKRHMSDRIEVSGTIAGKSIVTLKKDPVVTRKPLPVEEAARGSKILAEDKGVVVKNVVPESQVPTTAKALPKGEEETFIAEQRIPGAGETFEAYVCHVDTVDRFFVQRADSEIIQLSQEMQQYYQISSQMDVINKPKIGTMYCANYNGDWCRARVIFVKELDENGTSDIINGEKSKGPSQASCTYGCKVLYIDFGNMELVRSDRIRRLKSEFCSLPAQAIQCQLHGVTREGAEWDEETVAYFRQLTESDPLSVKVINVRDVIIDVDIHDPRGNSIADLLSHRGLATSVNGRQPGSLPNLLGVPAEGETLATGDQKDEEALLSPKSGILQRLSSLSIDDEEEIEATRVELPTGECIDLLVSAVNSLCEISGILRGNEYQRRLTILEAGMQAYYDCEETEKIESIETDRVYAAFHDEAWYRVKVTDVRDDEADIFFVDRGDNGRVQTAELRKLPAQFKRLPMQAIDLTLVNVPESDDPDYIQILSDMILGKECVAVLVERSCKDTLVELFDTSTEEDVNINKHLVDRLNLNDEQDFEQKLPKIDEQCDAFVPHVSDSGVFNVILPGSGLQKLDDLMEELAKHHSKVAKAADLVSNPKRDEIVAIKWKGDGCFYRVKITCILPAEKKAEVEFLDSGNREMVPFVALKEIPEHLGELKSLPSQTIKCRLADCPEEAETFWKSGLATRLSTELKTQTILLKVVKEQFEDDLALVEILKADPIDSSQFSSIADDIWTICSSMRESLPVTTDTNLQCAVDDVNLLHSDKGDFSQPSSCSSHEIDQDADGNGHERSIDSQISLTPPGSELSDGKAVLVLRDTAFPPLLISNSWSVVHVTAVVSPTSFYFQLHENLPTLIDLAERMGEFYKESADSFDECEVGDSCAIFVQEDDTWYRGIVRSNNEVDEEYHAGVFLADYGETKFFSTSEIRRLADEFKSLPLQAVKGALADVQVRAGGKWQKSICKEFSNLASHTLFYARIHVADDCSFPLSLSFAAKDPICLHLYDTRKDTEVTLNQVIADKMCDAS